MRPGPRNAQSSPTEWQKVAKAKVYITLNKAHNGIQSPRGAGQGQTWAPFLMSANGQWKRGNKTQVKCNGKAKQQGEVLHTGQNNTQTTHTHTPIHTPIQTATHSNVDSEFA